MLTHWCYRNSWALNNEDTRRALSQQQRETLRRPFYKWSREALVFDKGDPFPLHRSWEEDHAFVTEVETVLHDIATHLPDLSA